MLYDKTITLFNRHSTRQGDTWYPTVLENVQLIIDKAAILAKYGPNATDSAALNIRYRTEDGKRMIGKKQWLPPKEWDAREDKADTLTFTGEQFDFFWLGEWPDKSPINGADYTDGFYNHMNKTYDYVFAISSVGGPYGVIPHFEIMGK